jgi:DNA-binding winged helix-turn-helix (wHTH) protein/tetratricopeptide (TPR) repeat protein
MACSFEGFRLEADGTLWRGEAVVHLPPRELAALRLLLAHAGQVVSPVLLKNALWGDVHVTADSVPKCMSSLRARLEPDSCIQTVYKRGYRFTAEIRRNCEAASGKLVRIAIMPFATGHSVPEHLGSAMAEETTAGLSRTHGFAVAVLARDSVFTLAERGFTAHQIGRELKADFVLTGTLHAFSSLYRLRTEMIRVEDGTQIWVEDLLAPQNRTGELEQELMLRLAYRLGIRVPGDSGLSTSAPGSLGLADRSVSPLRGASGTSDAALSQRQSNAGIDISAAAVNDIEDHSSARHAEAYEIFLRARHEWQTLHRHRMQDGMQSLLRAIELDPTLISAKVDLAHLCVAQALYGFMPPIAAAELVHRMADTIPELSDNAEALLPALGWVNFHFDRNMPAAMLAFSYSSHLPHDLWTTRARSLFAISRRRFAEALKILREAICIDPFSPWLQSRLAWALHMDGQASESMELIRKMVAQFPDSEGTGHYGSVILAYNGEAEQAITIAQEFAQREPYFDPASAALAYALACAGRADEARVVLERLQWLSRERYVVRLFMPAAYVTLGDHQAALTELRAANEARCPWFFQMLANPCLKPLHGNPEFEQMCAILPAMEAEAEQELEMEA